MGHHGDDPFDGEMNPEHRKWRDEQAKKLKDMLNTEKFRGALGDFPEGKLTKSDEGAIQFAVTEYNGKVVMDFGTSTSWVGMTPQQAADLGSLLVKHARIAARKQGQSVSFTIGG